MGLRMGHVALCVADVEGFVSHMTAAIGLQVIEQSSDEALLASGDSRHELQLIRADAAAIDHVGLLVDSSEELDTILDSVDAAGGVVVDPHFDERDCERSVLVVGPAGLAYELYVPGRPLVLTLDRHLGQGLRRLGHLTFMSSEAAALCAFWGAGLGFRVSDEAGGFTWMRCDPHHHTLAVGPHPASTVLHHHAWEIQDVAALAKHCDVNAAAGRPQAWGPVRHGPGFNLATYMFDPAGSLIEVYCDLLTIDDDVSYAPMDWSDQPLALNLWGTMPSPETLAAGVPVAAVDRESRDTATA